MKIRRMATLSILVLGLTLSNAWAQGAPSEESLAGMHDNVLLYHYNMTHEEIDALRKKYPHLAPKEKPKAAAATKAGPAKPMTPKEKRALKRLQRADKRSKKQ